MDDYEYYREGMARIRQELTREGQYQYAHNADGPLLTFLDWVDKEMEKWLRPYGN